MIDKKWTLIKFKKMLFFPDSICKNPNEKTGEWPSYFIDIQFNTKQKPK